MRKEPTIRGKRAAGVVFAAALCCALALGAVGCSQNGQGTQSAQNGSETQQQAAEGETRTFTDSAGRTVEVPAQIDRIGVITAKIFEYQKSHPERSAQLHAFLSYYLPTTLKILRAYAQLESQGVEGENIAAAMSRIEGMMGKVVEGFEKQLDQLFQGDAMDITTDVAVLEQMLQKDGLSSSGGMQIGI